MDKPDTRAEQLESRLEKLQVENQLLSEQVQHLVKTEHELYLIQEQLDDQIRLYLRFYEVGKQFNTTFELAEIVQITTHFVLYDLNFERCLVLLSSAESQCFQVQAIDGYYDEETSQGIAELSLSVEEPALAQLLAGAERLMCTADCDQEASLDLGRKFRLNEYVLLPLRGESKQLLGLLVAGNTAEMAPYHTRVEPESELVVGLANLASQASIVINNANFYQALRKSEQKYRTLFEDSRDAIFISAPTGKFLEVNQAMLDLFGYTTTQMSSLDASRVYVDAAEHVGFQQAMEQAGSVRDYAVKLQKKDGTAMDCLLTATVRRGNAGQILTYQGIIRDITERKRQEEAERRLEAYRNSPLGRAEALAQSLLLQPETTLLDLYHLAQTTGQDTNAASLMSNLPQVLENLAAEPIAGLAEGLNYILASPATPELLPVGLRTVVGQLQRPPVANWPGSNAALVFYQLGQTMLEVNSVAQITQLLPNLQETESDAPRGSFAESPPGAAAPENFITDLAHTLVEFSPVAEALHAYERVDTSQDKLAYLASAVERLGQVERLARAELGSIDRSIIQGISKKWLAVVTGTMGELQTRAQLVCQLLTRHTWHGEMVSLVLNLRNEGRGAALNLKVMLAPAPEYFLVDEQATVDRLASGEEAPVEVRVRLHPKQSLDQIRARFIIMYADPRGPDQVEHFADVVYLLATPGEFQFIPNPYVVGTPLQPGSPLFFGREDLLAFIQENLAATHRNNLVLIGQRRTGKTSLLKQLPTRLGEDYLTVFLDGQTLGLDPGLANFCLNLATEIAFAVEDRGLYLEPPELDDFSDSPASAFKHRFLPQVRAIIGERHLLVLLDEFEELEMAIERGDLEASVFGFLRHLIQHTTNLSMIFCGTHRLEELAADYWNVLFNISLYRHVTYLTREEVLRLVQEPVVAYGLRYDDLALDKMWRVTAGHPYFLQLLCHSLVNQHNQTQRNYVTVADVNVALEEILAAGEAHFIYLWTESTGSERLTLTALSRMMPLTGRATPVQVIDYLAERGIKLERPVVSEALHHLSLRDVLTAGAASDPAVGEAYRWQLGLLGLWVEKYKSLSRVIDEVTL